jgi:hypothetical protein
MRCIHCNQIENAHSSEGNACPNPSKWGGYRDTTFEPRQTSLTLAQAFFSFFMVFGVILTAWYTVLSIKDYGTPLGWYDNPPIFLGLMLIVISVWGMLPPPEKS